VIAPRLRAPLVGTLVLAAGIGGLLAPQQSLLAQHAALKKDESPLYFPSALSAKLLSVGHRTTLADFMYMWSIQYFGDPTVEMKDRRAWLVRVYDTITDLDPKFNDAYWFGFVSLLSEVRSPVDAFHLADKSLRENPEFTWIAIEAAMAARQLKHTELSLHYLDVAAATGDAMAKRFAVTIRNRNAETAQEELAGWRTLQGENDKNTAYFLESHARDLTVLIDSTTLSAVAACYAREHRTRPATLEQLVTAGYLATIPEDPEGHPYVYDPRTMAVKSVTPYRWNPPTRAHRGVDLSGLGRCAPPPSTAASAEGGPPPAPQ
jgi:hypothetical protein